MICMFFWQIFVSYSVQHSQETWDRINEYCSMHNPGCPSPCPKVFNPSDKRDDKGALNALGMIEEVRKSDFVFAIVSGPQTGALEGKDALLQSKYCQLELEAAMEFHIPVLNLSLTLSFACARAV